MSGPVVLILRLLLAFSLYGFLGWAFVSLWRGIKQQASLLSSRTTPPIDLTLSHASLGSQVRHFTQPEVTLGRNPACECPLSDEAISSRHARLSYHHGQWWLTDLDSTNGTLLNQEKIAMPTVLISGDEFRCGETRITIFIPDEK
jgi:pSer/pThr/pTyr-binding forkhead associated (FHA) protein